MTDPIEARRADESDVADRARLEEALVEAHYLGHSLRAFAADPEFGFRQITASVCEPLIAWAKFVEARLAAGERPFGPGRAARKRQQAPFRQEGAFSLQEGQNRLQPKRKP